MTTHPNPPPGTDTRVGDVTAYDRHMTAEDAMVHDTLCAMQAPTGLVRLTEMMAAAAIRTARGAVFQPPEVKRVLERLLAGGHAKRDAQGRFSAAAPHGAARFAEMMRDAARAKAWFDAWRKLVQFDQAYSLGFQEEEQLAAALRLVIYGGGTLEHLDRLGQLVYTFTHLWSGALRRAVLQPFDAALFDGLESALRSNLVEQMLVVVSGFVESPVRVLEDWLLADAARLHKKVSPMVRLRLAETLLFRAELAGARALCASVESTAVEPLQALFVIAEGQWEAGAQRFEAGWKIAGAEAGRRKNLMSPSVEWIYLMALLALPTPVAWSKARKFAASEAGKRDAADPYGFWGVWVDAIDQRLGDAPKAHAHFRLTHHELSGMQSLQYLHHLLLAAWLRVEVPKPAELRKHAAALAQQFDAAGMAWPARLVRRAAAALLREAPAAADADMPFFVGAAQDSWREALASIMALGGDAADSPRGASAALPDRLIWLVSAGKDGRITTIEPMEQKAGVRGLGKPKAVALATLAKRKDLATHDAALLRALRREDYGNRPVLDIVEAAPALVRHPFVAWEREPTRFIEVNEGLPALEIMTQGEHIGFRLLDPVRTEAHRKDEAQDELLPPRWRTQRARLRGVMLLPDGEGRARLVRLTPAQLRVDELVSQGWKVPVAARTELDAALRVLAAHFQVASDAETGHEVQADRRLRAELVPHGAGLRLALLAAPFGDFGPRLGPGSGRTRVTTVHQALTLSTRRDLGHEREVFDKLLEVLDFLEDDVHEWALDDPEQALAAVEGLSRLGADIVTEWPKGKPMRVRAVAEGSVKLRASSKGEWLELDGELELDGGEVLRLRQLLDLSRESRSRFVALGEGDFLALSDTLRQQLSDLATLAQPHKQGQRLAGVAALAWEASGHGLVLDGDAPWRKRAASWAQAQERVFELPASLGAELRDYQLEGYRWLMRLAESGFGAVLADDMGLGKTVQTLALLLQRAAGGPALVVAPTSVCGNWLLEAARFAPSLQVGLYGDVLTGDEPEDEALDADTPQPDEAAVAQGTAAADAAPTQAAASADNARRAARRRQVRALGPGQVLVCSYALLQIDADILAAPRWHSIVLDEAQAIKNPATRRAKAALALQGDFRLALTGTPIENRLGELWSIMGFCNPGLLGSAEQFSKNFANPIEREPDPHPSTTGRFRADSSPAVGRTPQGGGLGGTLKAQSSRRLRRLLSPFLKRRTKSEVLTDLPPRTEIVHEVVPGAKERALLEALRQQAEASVAQAISANASAGGGREGQNQFHVLAALTRLRRAACDPRLVAPELGLIGAKVLEFERLAVELVAGRHKALVFSQFTDFLALLRERLDLAGLSYQYLDGSTPAAERGKRIAAFQAGTGDLFLISLKAGGFGLNLTAADYVIIADPWWNPASEEQASARAHRIGQQRPVTVYRLVTQGSIEEKIVRLHRSKRDLAEGILSGEDAGAPIDAAQLMELLRAQ
ncbi:MAG TPA: DEAD/DEAH box helicase [Rubrivivax sp.]|nr:DEAD/DEAH box helicase [Rubrivivax sp.]